VYQSITILGNLGRDPELRRTRTGTPVTSFSVATNRHYDDGTGQGHERTTWFRVSAWGNLAEPCANYLRKGRQVFVVGEIVPSEPWKGRDGEWHASLEVTARVVKFLGGKGQWEEVARGQEDEQPIGASGDDEVPF